ncbi:MAG: cytochrome c, partial [Verrucomicrobiota bacterium]|nr:cytochrome c [Verrucomicrobiota bacterium]
MRLLQLFSLAILFTVTEIKAAEPIDHVVTIKELNNDDAKKGHELYTVHCSSCHGKDGDLALNPLARRFAKDELKFGSDPYS